MTLKMRIARHVLKGKIIGPATDPIYASANPMPKSPNQFPNQFRAQRRAVIVLRNQEIPIMLRTSIALRVQRGKLIGRATDPNYANAWMNLETPVPINGSIHI
jgi:hypothetical protein